MTLAADVGHAFAVAVFAAGIAAVTVYPVYLSWHDRRASDAPPAPPDLNRDAPDVAAASAEADRNP